MRVGLQVRLPLSRPEVRALMRGWAVQAGMMSFNRAADLETTLHRFVWLYNEHLPQRAPDLNMPIQALKNWQATHADLFTKRVVNPPGPES